MPIARWVFAALLLSTALGQSLSLPEFVNAIGSYRVAGEAGSSVLAWVLLLLQAMAGAGLSGSIYLYVTGLTVNDAKS